MFLTFNYTNIYTSTLSFLYNIIEQTTSILFFSFNLLAGQNKSLLRIYSFSIIYVVCI